MTTWTMGVPPVAQQISDLVEVTDGNRCDLARFQPGKGLPTERHGEWLLEDGAPLAWRPTHWRPSKPHVAAPTFDIE